jgi:hypothetical protein
VMVAWPTPTPVTRPVVSTVAIPRNRGHQPNEVRRLGRAANASVPIEQD